MTEAAAVGTVRPVPAPLPSPLTCLHLFGVSPRMVPLALLRMGLDRRHLRATPGLRFWKLVGTGDGRTFTVRDADPCRWGMVTVWDGAEALDRFERRSAVIRAWSSIAEERWRVDLRPLRSRGRWSGREPFGPPTAAASSSAPVAAITRARIDFRQARRFWRSVPPVSANLHARPGLRFAVGFGEAPIGVQGTFSVWDSERALTRFAYAGQPHRDAITNTERLQWYREELFARFAIIGSHGTVDGVDPVAPSPGIEPDGAHTGA